MKRILARATLVLALLGAGPALAQDSVITERVTSALAADPALKDTRIAVATQDGVVRLTGFVDSMAQLERAAVLARAVQGVSAVKNALRVAIRPSRA